LLLELGDVLRPWVVEQVLADEGRLSPLRRPPGEPLRALQRDLADEVLVRRTGRLEYEAVAAAVYEIDEAGVDGAPLREQPHDGAQDVLELERRRDRRDDLLQHTRLARARWHGRMLDSCASRQ